MRLRIAGTLIAVGLLALVSDSSHAAPPGTIAFQGALNSSGGAPVSGAHTMTFTLYDAATGGNALWTETKTVNVAGGTFSTALGDSTPLSEAIRFDRPYWVGVKVGSDAEMTPRLLLTGAPYAMAIPGVTPDWSGRYVGIGTTTPITPLDVVVDTYTSGGQALDQQVFYNLSHGMNLRAVPGQTLSQSFVAGATGNITRIDLFADGFDTGGASATYTGTVSLHSGGSPAGTLIGEYNISGPIGFTWREFDFAPGFAVTSGDTYTFTVTPTGVSRILLNAANNDVYAFGNAFEDSSPQDGVDLMFKTYVTTTSGMHATPALAVDTDADVGIGTTAPGQKLEIMGGGIRLSRALTGGDTAHYDLSYEPATTAAPIVPGYFYVDQYGKGRRISVQDDTGNVGIGTTNPTSKLDVRGNIKMNSSGNMYASGGPENLYVVRGTVNANGSVALGAGFTVSHPSVGHYTITIPGSTYAQPPTVTVTPWTDAPIFAVVPYILGQPSGATFNTTLYEGTVPVDSAFSFVATANH